jgi:hypothetical protein
LQKREEIISLCVLALVFSAKGFGWRRTCRAGATATADLLVDRGGRGAKDKVALARRLRHETSTTLNWIPERLNLGAAGSLANLLLDTERKR